MNIVKFLGSVTFKRIFIIFVVGLASRSVVNWFFDINVFKEYTEVISLVYYGFMACFAGFLHEFSNISLNIFKFDLIRSAIRNVVSDISFLFKDKMLYNDRMFIDNLNYSKINDHSVYKQHSPDKTSYGRIPRFKSAGLRGLYGDPNNRDINDLGSSENKYNLRNKVKCRIMWSVWKQFTSEYVSYKDYLESFNSNQRVSIIGEVKKSVTRRK